METIVFLRSEQKMLVKLKDYKVARQFKQDSVEILRVLDLATKALTFYKHYVPCKKVIAEMNNQKAILNAHLNTANKLLEKKDA